MSTREATRHAACGTKAAMKEHLEPPLCPIGDLVGTDPSLRDELIRGHAPTKKTKEDGYSNENPSTHSHSGRDRESCPPYIGDWGFK
jgi:hypothetical protein